MIMPLIQRTIFKVKTLTQFTSKQLSIAKHTCIALCVGLGFSFNVDAGGKSGLDNTGKSTKPVVEDEVVNEGLQQTLNLNFSPESREKLRKALDEYARSIDSDHDRIEARRRAMQESLEARFFDADNDADGTVDRQEATEKLPQIARHFNQVDINQDGVISLDELEEAQARILERRKAAEEALEAQKVQAAEEAAEVTITGKPKVKQTANNVKKRAL
jgi:Ca2+-binding EF-hand superfamily protein